MKAICLKDYGLGVTEEEIDAVELALEEADFVFFTECYSTLNAPSPDRYSTRLVRKTQGPDQFDELFLSLGFKKVKSSEEDTVEFVGGPDSEDLVDQLIEQFPKVTVEVIQKDIVFES